MRSPIRADDGSTRRTSSTFHIVISLLPIKRTCTSDVPGEGWGRHSFRWNAVPLPTDSEGDQPQPLTSAAAVEHVMTPAAVEHMVPLADEWLTRAQPTSTRTA